MTKRADDIAKSIRAEAQRLRALSVELDRIARILAPPRRGRPRKTPPLEPAMPGPAPEPPADAEVVTLHVTTGGTSERELEDREVAWTTEASAG